MYNNSAIDKVLSKKKPGRPAGSGKKTERLNIRVDPVLIDLLQAMGTSCEGYTGMSMAEIIHKCVANAAAFNISMGALKVNRGLENQILKL